MDAVQAPGSSGIGTSSSMGNAKNGVPRILSLGCGLEVVRLCLWGSFREVGEGYMRLPSTINSSARPLLVARLSVVLLMRNCWCI
jgi:hypothetical protein